MTTTKIRRKIPLLKKVRKLVNRRLLSRLNLCLESTRSRDIYDFEDQANDLIRIVEKHTMVSAPRLVTLYQQVRCIELNRIEGAFVECGVWKGGAAGMMALSQLKLGKAPRALHLFDSFEGLPKASDEDDEKSKSWLGVSHSPATTGKLVADIAIAKHLLLGTIRYPEEYVHFHKGWFQDTVPKARENGTIPKIALLRLDGDLYESTKVCLEYLWDLVVPRGIVVIDDYNFFGGCRKAVDEFLERLDYKPLLNHIPDGGGRYVIKV